MLPSQPYPTGEPVFSDLNGPQSRGQACVVCNRSFIPVDGHPVPSSVPVGSSTSTGRPVLACEVRCAPMVGFRPAGREVQQTLL